MIIKEMPISERPREKMVSSDPSLVSNRELLAILIGNGTRKHTALQLADRLLHRDSRGIRHLSECTINDFMSIEGIGKAKACRLMAAVELGRRLATVNFREERRITSSEDVAAACMEKMRHLKKEHFNALLLNAKGMVIGESNISVGDLSGSIVHPREAFKSAVERSAHSVVFVHNHPSGDPTPSKEDINITKRLVQAGKVMGIAVHDHVIIGDGTHISLREEGVMDQ